MANNKCTFHRCFCNAATWMKISAYSQLRSQSKHKVKSDTKLLRETHLKKSLDDKLNSQIICFDGFISVVFLQEFTYRFSSSANGISLEWMGVGRSLELARNGSCTVRWSETLLWSLCVFQEIEHKITSPTTEGVSSQALACTWKQGKISQVELNCR